MNEFYERLEQLKSLKKGWDGYHAEPPNLRACHNAQTFLACMDGWDVKPDRVVPSVVGGIGVCWKSPDYENNKKKAYFEFANKGYVLMLLTVHQKGGEIITEVVADFSLAIRKAARYIGVELVGFKEETHKNSNSLVKT